MRQSTYHELLLLQYCSIVVYGPCFKPKAMLGVMEQLCEWWRSDSAVGGLASLIGRSAAGRVEAADKAYLVPAANVAVDKAWGKGQREAFKAVA